MNFLQVLLRFPRNDTWLFLDKIELYAFHSSTNHNGRNILDAEQWLCLDHCEIINKEKQKSRSQAPMYMSACLCMWVYDFVGEAVEEYASPFGPANTI